MSDTAKAATAPPRSAGPNAGRSTFRVLQRKCACGGMPASGGECEECKHKRIRGLQTKLRVNAPGDKFEQEADQLVESAFSGSGADLHGRKAGPVVQRVESDGPNSFETPSIVNEVLESSGQSLDAGMRTFMERRLGHNFGHVRIHTDARASESARQLNAAGYTVQNHVVLASDHYSPETVAGKRLLAHELVHTLQQGLGGRRASGFSPNHQSAGIEGAAPLPELFLQRQTVCPPRAASETSRSQTSEGILPVNVEFSESGGMGRLDIMDFAVGSDTLPTGTTTATDWQRAVSLMQGDPLIRVAISGYTDCAGSHTENFELRQRRTAAVRLALPAPIRARVIFDFVASTTSFLASNSSEEGRARNRSVRVTFSSVPARADQSGCDQINRAANLDQYLFLARCAEERLGLTRPQDAPTALSVLRQLYYGARNWSISQNPVWSSVIPNAPWAPGTDPRPRLGGALAAALSASQQVEGIDLGHLFTGLDAMMNPGAVEFTRGRFAFSTGIQNEEWATWAGDVGSAAAESAVDDFAQTTRGNADFYFRSFASPADLEGDIDSFAIRAGLSGGARPPAQLQQAIRLTGRVSELLLQYYRLTQSPVGRSRAGRITNFIEAYGGVVSGRTIANRVAFTARLREPIQGFAGYFGMFRYAQRGFLNQTPQRPPGAASLGALLANAIDAMTDRFVTWLEGRL